MTLVEFISPWKVEEDAVQRKRIELTFETVSHLRFENFLEMGCDTGFLTQKLSGVCSKMTAVDISSSAIAYAKKTKSLVNVDWIVADFTQFDISKNAFNGISFVECLYYFDDPTRDRLLRAAYNGLKSGGYFLFGAPVKQPKKKWDYDESRYFDSPTDMIRLISKSGFKIRDEKVTVSLPGWIQKIRNYVILAQK